MKRFVDSLSLRLFLALSGVGVAVLLLYAALNYRTIQTLWMETTREYAQQTSDLVKRATRYGMLLNRKDDVHQVISRLAEQPGIAGIRIYDKQGAIIFSTDSAEIGHKVDPQAEACVLCHSQSEPLRSVPTQNRMRIYDTPDGDRVMGLINPIENERECYNASCHAHSKSQTILGVLDVRMSMAALQKSVHATQRNTVGAALLGAFLVAITAALFIIRWVRIPVHRLTAEALRVADGDLTGRVKIQEPGELGKLGTAFNHMTEELEKAQRELQEWSAHLELKVKDKTEELGRSQKLALQMEKMASLGKLAASVAHELNNPLAGILNYAKLMARELRSHGELDASSKEMLEYLEHIQRESGRCGDIVKNLLLFARRSPEALAHESMAEIVNRAIMVVRHHLEMRQIQYKIEGPDGDDRLVCDANEIQQALIALFVNAVEAMSEGGLLTVRILPRETEIETHVADTGAGVPPNILPHIFEPFFSTKEEASGVGLGLAVVYGIVQRHAGRIDVESAPGKGATFHIVLPRSARSNKGDPT